VWAAPRRRPKPFTDAPNSSDPPPVPLRSSRLDLICEDLPNIPCAATCALFLLEFPPFFGEPPSSGAAPTPTFGRFRHLLAHRFADGRPPSRNSGGQAGSPVAVFRRQTLHSKAVFLSLASFPPLRFSGATTLQPSFFANPFPSFCQTVPSLSVVDRAKMGEGYLYPLTS